MEFRAVTSIVSFLIIKSEQGTGGWCVCVCMWWECGMGGSVYGMCMCVCEHVTHVGVGMFVGHGVCVWYVVCMVHMWCVMACFVCVYGMHGVCMCVVCGHMVCVEVMR